MAQGVWVKVFPPPPVVKPELPGLGGWADVTAASVSPTTYTDAAGVAWKCWTFLADGSLTLTAGMLDVLVVGGGGYGSSIQPGAGARIHHGATLFPAGVHPVAVSDGGNYTVDQSASPSSIGTVVICPSTGNATVASAAASVTGAGGTVANPKLGYTSSITGTPVTYATAAVAAPAPNTGDGAGRPVLTGNGSTGIVVVRRPA